MTLENASLLLLIGAKASTLAGRNTDLRGSREGKSREPRQRFRSASLDAAEVHIHMFSSRHSLSWFRVPYCDQHRWEQLQCHAHSITKRHASQQWRHEQQLLSIGLRRQVFRSRGISRSLYLSQSSSGPGVRIHFVDAGELQFLSEFGEISSFVASDKGVVFFTNDDMQRGEAQITNQSGDLYQLASLSLPTHVAELMTDLLNLAPQVFHDAATALFARLPPQHRRLLSGNGSGGSVSEPSRSTVRRSGD